MADSGHFDGFQAPLSSALFRIRLVTKHFSKTKEDRSPAGTAISHHAAILPGHTGKVYHSGHFSPGESAYPAHSSDSVVGTPSPTPLSPMHSALPVQSSRYPHVAF